jgi:hypothetical protein
VDVLAAVARDDARRFLAPVLKRIQPQVGQVRGPGWPAMPITPHSSRSGQGSRGRPSKGLRQRSGPDIVRLGEGDVDPGSDADALAPRASDARGGHAVRVREREQRVSVAGNTGRDRAAGRLGKERELGPTVRSGEHGLDADAGADRALGERDRRAALGAIVRGAKQTATRGLHEQILKALLGLEVERRWRAALETVAHGQILARTELGKRLAEQDHRIARGAERGRHGARDVLEQADHADRRRGRDRALPGRLVVEAHVARDDRHTERAAGVADAADRLRELPHALGPFRVSEIQTVRRRERPRAGDRDVARRFGHGMRRAQVRVLRAVARIAVGLQRETALGLGHAHDRGVTAGSEHGR